MSAPDQAVVRLRPGRDRSLRRRHPWVFSGSLADEPRRLPPGGTVTLLSADGDFLARAAWSPESQIRARVWTFAEDESIDEQWFERRIDAAVRAREDAGLSLEAAEAPPRRLVHAESDGLPGLVVDRYGEVVVAQFLAAGVEHWKPAIVRALARRTGATSIYERSDADVRHREGLLPTSGLLDGRQPPELVAIDENGRRYLVDVREGHKTGFYLDQRRGRDAAARWCRGREVLDAFCYSGGFSVAALSGGARRVTALDSSAAALAMAVRNVEANGVDTGPEGPFRAMEADVFAALRRMRDSRAGFDAIVLDPPKFADSRGHVERAARGYKDINLLAFKLLRPGGVLLTFSCSGAVGPDLFQKIVAGAALDSGRDAAIVERLDQGGDHPVSLAFPEGAYLKGLVCRVA